MNYPQESVMPYGSDGKKSEQIGRMFDHIAPVYDRLNHILSGGIDKRWRRKAIAWLKPFRPQRIMDAATGTGDFALLIHRELHPELLIGTDISEGMINIGKEKAKKEGLSGKIHFIKEDCTSLSFDNDFFDAVTVTFGIRNFDDLDKGLSEMYRVLKKEGCLVILELSIPDYFPIKQLYVSYSKTVIPFLGKLLSKDSHAYRYLPRSIKAIPQGEVMKNIITHAGFSKVSFRRLTCGVCTLYTAKK
ncbi:Ubiquinone/menaquinone biosynthesis C-methyltransferase UbiE [termite gut metagenome]|uniref:Ubiquinone/menaquinone biosynthesis C-methyltransferase UbiE n=1 Tax=termite gut metagenome TaxID=433724 RepID=A0A5J4T062_9ZZZZ